MAIVGNAPATLDLVVRQGSDFALTFTVELDGDPYDFTGATVTAKMINAAGAEQTSVAWTPTTSTGELVLTLDETATALIQSGWRYYVDVTKASITQPWVAGALSPVALGRGGRSSSTATLSITTDTGATLTISADPGQGVAAHLADTSDAHDASAISFAPSGTIAGTDVQTAVAEVASDAAAALAAHVDDTSDAHDASAISLLDTGGHWTATTVEGALAEVPSRYQPLDSDLTAIAALTTTPFGRSLLELANAGALAGDAAFSSRYAPRPASDGTVGQVLRIAGVSPSLTTEWASGSGGASALDDLTDVTITAAASGDILRHNGTAWVDAAGSTYFEAAGAVAAHEADTTNVHGIADTSVLLTTTAAPELIRDTIGTALAGSGWVTVTPNDGADTITVSTSATKVAVATYSSGWPARPSADLVFWVSSDRAATTPGAATGDDIVILPAPLVPLMYALSDESTAITTGTAKLTVRAPYACSLSAVRASLNTVSSSGTPTVDINVNGSSILSTKLTIDANEKTSATAATAAVISASSIADDDEITFDIDTAGTGAKGLKVTLYVVPT